MKKLLLILSTLFFMQAGFSQTPGSDCGVAISVLPNGCSTIGQYDNTGITGTLAAPSCFDAGANNGMWFQFQASTPVVNVTVNGGTLVQPMVSLLSSTSPCASPFTELACNTSTTNTTTLSYSSLTVNTIYYLYVDGALDNVGTFQLCLSSPNQPANDNPCNATLLPNVQNFCSGPNSFTNVGATGEPLTSSALPACFDNPGTMNSVFFMFTAVGSTVQITINGNIVRPQLALITPTAGCSGTDYTVNSCVQAATGNSVTLNLGNLVAGQVYYILVDGFSANTGTFEICINNYIPTGTVQNDNCSNAILLCPNNQYFATTVGATPTNDPNISQWICNGVVDNTVWFKFTTTNPVQPINFSINGSCTSGALQFEVFRKTSTGDPCATNNQWSSVGCNSAINPSGSTALSIPVANLLPSTNYYIVVDNFPGESCDFNFTITGNQGAVAGVDQSVCLNAPAFNLAGFTPLSGGTWSGPGITNATTGNFNPATAGIGTHSLFYSFAGCTDVKTITVSAPAVSVSPDVNLCAGQCATLLASATQTQTNVTNPSFTNTSDFNIPDANTTGITSNISVSGLGSSAFPSSVCLNINHGFTGDLDIFLKCPDGTQIELSTDNGGGGDNYSNTCFNLTSAVNITSGAAPFNAATGYLPENSLSVLNGCNMNGTWSLIVKDDGLFTSGTLLDWTITFTNSVTTSIPAPFTWSPTTDMTNSTTLTPQVCPTATTASSQTYTLTSTDANGCVAVEQVIVSIAPLAITASNDQTICAGATVNLTANGALTYSWASPNTGDLSGTSGANVSASPTVTTTYTVTGTSGTCTDTEEITINVSNNLNPNLTYSPICENQTLNLTSDIGGGTYTWSGPGGYSSSIQNPTIANATVANNGVYSYTVTSSGCSGTATLTVSITPTVTPSFTQVGPFCTGTTFSLSTTSDNAIIGTWAPTIDNTTTTTYTFTPNSGQCANNTTMQVVVANGIPATFNALTPICAGQTLTLPATSSEGFTGTWLPALDNTTSQTYTFTPDAGQCALTGTLTSTVNPVPTISAVNSQTVCAGQQVNGITFSSTAANTTVDWLNTESGVGLAVSGSGDITTFTGTNSGNATLTGVVTATPTAGSCTGSPVTFSITVNPIPSLSAINSQTVCANQSVSAITFTSSVTGSTIGWTNTDATIGLSASGTGNINSFNGTNSGTSSITGVVTVVPSVNSCVGSPITFSVTVDPIPVLTAVNSQTVCTGQQVNGVTFSSTPTGSTINWTNTESTIGLVSSGTGDITSFTGLNTGNNTLTGTITATPTANGCNGLPQTFSVTVNPIPVLTSIASQTVCAGQTVNGITYTSTVTNTSVNWTNTTSGIGLSSNGTGNINSFTGSNTTTTPLTGTVTATPSANGCDGLPQTFSVTVNPNPIDITAPPTDETCGLSNGSLEVTNANGGTAPYQFSIDGGANAPAPVTLTNLSAGAYTITVTDANGCVFTKTVTINNIPGPDADFTANQLTGLDSIDVVFTNQSSSGANIDYYWNFGNGILDTTSTLSASPSQEYFGTNSYTVTLIASNGNPSCNDTASIFIFVDISPYIEVPNVFSPNGDGLNEFFNLKYKGYKELNLIIYNRWGNKMYETTNPAVGWDGSGASEGTYFYIVTGKGNDNKDFEAKGYLTLVR